MIPSLPKEARKPRVKPPEALPEIHRVMEYTGLNMLEVLNLPIDFYMAVVRRATLDRLEATKEGREYLEQCERLNAKTVDTEALDAFIKADTLGIEITQF